VAIAHKHLNPTTSQARCISGLTFGELGMTTISMVSMGSVVRVDDRSLKTIVGFCCLGLVASLCLATLGMDLGAGWL